MRNAGLEGAQAGIKIAGRNINNLRSADDMPNVFLGCVLIYFFALLQFCLLRIGDNLKQG